MVRSLPVRPGGSSSGEGDTDGDGDDDGDDGGPPNKGTGGDKGSKGGGGESGAPGGDAGRTPVAVRSRAFLRDATQGVYALTIHPPHPRPAGEVYLSVAAVGDDSLSSQVRLRSARLAGNRRLDVTSSGRVGPVTFPITGPLRVDITLSEPRRLALDVAAHEEHANETE